ncbi:MAG: hypothetical protein J7513_02600 [Solirubrobacteraceae bacterium]|nr:hypothetical protein [Solirubrobacteraceae bacterium]
MGLQTECPGSDSTFVSGTFPTGTTQLDLAVYCQQSGCAYGAGPLYDFAIAIYSSEVTIEENTPPSVGALTMSGGGGGYVGRQTKLNFSGSDTLGIRRFELLRDGQVSATVDRTCVDWSVLPCSEPDAGLSASASGSRTVAEAGLYEGKQSVRVRATDGAGNTALSDAVELTVDTFPWEITGMRGIGPSRDQERVLEWRLSGDGAPIASASARICRGTGPAPADCTDTPINPSGPMQVSLPADGSSATVAITLTDVAGNTSTSPAYLLTRDTVAPAAPTLTLTGSNGTARAVAVAGEAGATIRASLCPATGGGQCTTLSNATAPATVGVSLGNPGNYDLKVTLMDAAGNVSPTSTLRLTRQATQSELRPFTLSGVDLATSRSKRRITVKGKAPVGSTTRIDAKLTGRTSRGKLVTRKATVKVSANGKYSARIAFPKSATSRRGLKLVLTPRPATGWRATSYRKTIRVK